MLVPQFQEQLLVRTKFTAFLRVFHTDANAHIRSRKTLSSFAIRLTVIGFFTFEIDTNVSLSRGDQ